MIRLMTLAVFGIIACVISWAIMTATPSQSSTPGPVIGDVNCDGVTDSVDALLILRYTASVSVSLPPGCSPIGAPPYSGTLMPDRGEGGVYSVNDTLVLCYSLNPQTPFRFRIFESVEGGPEKLVAEANDTGTGDCLSFTGDGSDAGRNDFRIEFWVSGEKIAEAGTYIVAHL